MWKTTAWDTATCHLCPDCDSLGPHLAWYDEDVDEGWLDCIDCGALLGRLTPRGLEPLGNEKGLDSASLEGFALRTRAC